MGMQEVNQHVSDAKEKYEKGNQLALQAVEGAAERHQSFIALRDELKDLRERIAQFEYGKPRDTAIEGARFVHQGNLALQQAIGSSEDTNTPIQAILNTGQEVIDDELINDFVGPIDGFRDNAVSLSQTFAAALHYMDNMVALLDTSKVTMKAWQPLLKVHIIDPLTDFQQRTTP